MSEIRLLLASLPVMLGEILTHAVAREPDLRVVEECSDLSDLSQAMRRSRPDVLVVGTDGETLPPECVRAMHEVPGANTLTISRDGRLATAYRLRPEGRSFDNASARELIAAIRELMLAPPELRD